MYYSPMDNSLKNDDKLCYFIQGYLDSKKNISESINSNINNPKKETYFAIDSNWVSQFKDHLGFHEIIAELKKRNIKKITEKDFEWIKKIMEKYKKKGQLRDLDNSQIFFDKSIKKSVDVKKDFELISPLAWDLIKNSEFKGNKNDEFEKKVEVIKGLKNVLVILDNYNFLILCKESSKHKKYDEYAVSFDYSCNKNKIKEISEDVLNKYTIPEWFKKINYNSDTNEEVQIKFYEIPFTIKKIIKNQDLIDDDDIDDNNEKEKKSLISDDDNSTQFDDKNLEIINFCFPKKIVQKIESSSYIIVTMESLAQIFNFSHYFINKEIKNDEKGIAFEFKDYMENLLKDNSEMFTPMKFIKKLIKINKKQFTVKEELDPYIFYNYILNQLNDELNDKDKDIKKYFENFNKKYLENKEIEGNNDLKDYIKQFSEKNNSIVSKTFYGLYKISENCGRCKQEEKIKYEKFNVIDIDLYEYFNYIYEKGDSITTVYFDDILDYFFTDRMTEEKVLCKEKKNNGTGKKIFQINIIELPNYLIFRLKLDETKKGNFMKKSYKFIDINDTIEIKKEYFDEDIAYNKNNLITDSVKYQLFSTIDYWEKSKKYICKYKIKENNKTNKWYSFWCNSEGKEVGTFKDDFTSPCMLFYEKI